VASGRVIAPVAVGDLIADLRARGYRVIGPRRRDGAIVYDDIEDLADLPAGWTDEQAPGHYRLTRRDDQALFGYAVGPHSWKRQLFPPRHRLWSTVPDGDDGFSVVETPRRSEKLALFGVRGCELAAIAMQDRIFLGGAAVDTVYAANREDVVLIAVDCHTPAATCFCPSMGTGPGAGNRGADLVLTELLDTELEDGHQFLARPGSPLGEELVAGLGGRPVGTDDLDRADRQEQAARACIVRTVDADRVHDGLLGNLEHERWDEVASRCLDCGNCTMVCPTCFCSQVEDTTDLDGNAHHDRRWDSCFTLDHSHLAHGSVHATTRSRYRQWATHKFATWIDQFGTSGCVGCGRCLTWCPVGIDITEEVAAIIRPASPETTSAQPEGVTP